MHEKCKLHSFNLKLSVFIEYFYLIWDFPIYWHLVWHLPQSETFSDVTSCLDVIHIQTYSLNHQNSLFWVLYSSLLPHNWLLCKLKGAMPCLALFVPIDLRQFQLWGVQKSEATDRPRVISMCTAGCDESCPVLPLQQQQQQQQTDSVLAYWSHLSQLQAWGLEQQLISSVCLQQAVFFFFRLIHLTKSLKINSDSKGCLDVQWCQ